MAIARGAGTEIIRSIHVEDVANTARVLIFGVQHHIYTVLSVVVWCYDLHTAGNWSNMYIRGYDSNAGTTNQEIKIFKTKIGIDEVFVWNDKFSFNGHEPTDFAGPMDSIVKQDAIADQGSAVAQKLEFIGSQANDRYDITCTYIDQNNA